MTRRDVPDSRRIIFLRLFNHPTIADHHVDAQTEMVDVARECGVGSGTVQRIRQEMEGPFVGEADGAQMKLKRPSTRCPLYPQKRTLILQPRMSALCRYCCKSLQTLGDDFFG